MNDIKNNIVVLRRDINSYGSHNYQLMLVNENFLIPKQKSKNHLALSLSNKGIKHFLKIGADWHPEKTSSYDIFKINKNSLYHKIKYIEQKISEYEENLALLKLATQINP